MENIDLDSPWRIEPHAVYTISQVAKRFAVTTDTLKRWIRGHDDRGIRYPGPALRCHRTKRILGQWILDFLEGHGGDDFPDDEED